MLERLEAKGRVLRSPSPVDKRVKLLHLTLDGERLLRRAEPAVKRVQQRLMEPLPSADRAAMLRLLLHLATVHNELCPNLGDDGLRRAVYRGGWKPA